MRKIFNLFLVFVLLFSLLSTVAMAKDDTLDKILKEGVVKAGFCADVPPIKFRDKNNEPAGLCDDLYKLLARDLGVKLEYVFSDWAGIIPTLLSGRSDIVISDANTTLERAKKVNFSDPYMVTGSCIVVRNDSEWTSWKDMNKKGVKIGCILGTIGEQSIKSMFPEATPLIYNSHVEQTLALEQGRIDGLTNDMVLASRTVTKSNGKLRLLPDPLEKDAVAGIMLRSDDYHFLIWINLWMVHIKATGEFDKLMDYWIYTNKWEKDYPGY